MDRERRAHERATLQGQATLTTGRGNIGCELVDISRGGVAIRARGATAPGEFVRVRLGLPLGGATKWMDPDAFVVRAQPGADSSVFGLQFVNLDEGTASLIIKYVTSAQEADPAQSGLRSTSRDEKNKAILALLQQQPRRTDADAKASAQPGNKKRSEGVQAKKKLSKTDRELRDLYRAAVQQAGPSDKR